MNKVEIGEIVYVKYRAAIYKEKVYMIGKHGFCHEDVFNPFIINDYRCELYYEDEGETWFRTLKEAKKSLKEEYPNCKAVKKCDWYWEAEFDD